MYPLRFLKYGSRVFFKRGMMPLYMIHFITENCNANCFHCLCGYHAHWERNELTVDEIERFSRSLGDLLFVFLTGGEPFLRDDIAEIARIYYQNNKVKKFQIPSNGSMTEKQLRLTEEIVRACPDAHVGVTISIDGLRDLHNRERNFKGLFDRSIATYLGLRKLEEKYKNFGVNMTTCVTNLNQDHLRELFDYVIHDLGVRNYFNTFVRGVPADPRSVEVDIAKFEEFSRWQDEALVRGEMRGYADFAGADFINAKNLLSRNMIAKTYKENKRQVTCHTGKLSFVLRSTGQIFPCELLNKPMGNLRDVNYDFKKIWYSPRADEIRKWIRDTKCFCTHECFMTLNILFSPSQWPRLVQRWGAIKLGRLRHRIGPGRRDSVAARPAAEPAAPKSPDHAQEDPMPPTSPLR